MSSSCGPSSLVEGPVLLQHPIGVLEPLEPLRVKGCLKNLGVALAGERRSSAASVRSLDGNHGWAFLKMRRVLRYSRCSRERAQVWVDQQMDLISASVAGRLRFSW